MNLLKWLLVGGSWKTHAFSTQLLSSLSGGVQEETNSPPCVIVFGRPGAGKSTVANAAVKLLADDPKICCLGLDLDVCVPQWMRDNFAKGIYPTLNEREIFALECCDYVENEFEDKVSKTTSNLAAIISFSFVNTDLRDVFRSRFPSAKWLLIDTMEDEATRRINSRQDHFYKGEQGDLSKKLEAEKEAGPIELDNDDNSEWKFAPVTFEHVALDGSKGVEENAKYVAQVLRDSIEVISYS
jgi:gluconate kinase